MTQLTSTAESFLESLAEALDVPERRYASSIVSYQSIGKWLQRPESAIAQIGSNVYAQGSFQLGTVIRPVIGGEVYDLDIVCEVDQGKLEVTQRDLKHVIGNELKLYAESRRMDDPQEGQYCWTLAYADEAQFSVDVLPSLPDGTNQRLLLEARRLAADWADSALGITNKNHQNYEQISDEWPVSNPSGFANWFRSRMRLVFEARRQAMALAEGTSDVQKIPEYRVKTPLQRAVQILKHHRNMVFVDDPDARPTSVLITTLAAHAYQQEQTISAALYGILSRMDKFIEFRHGEAWVPNPSDPRENFADRWAHDPRQKEAFDEWLALARSDFERAGRSQSREDLAEVLAPHFGRALVEKASGKRLPSLSSRFLQLFTNVSHKQQPSWPLNATKNVEILSAKYRRDGFRPKSFQSGGAPLPKGCDLTFTAATDVPPPFDVFWQIVNTGEEARSARGLRGGFDRGRVDRGRLQRNESTSYTGSHSIECFIVKDGLCLARSGPFVVNIK